MPHWKLKLTVCIQNYSEFGPSSVIGAFKLYLVSCIDFNISNRLITGQSSLQHLTLCLGLLQHTSPVQLSPRLGNYLIPSVGLAWAQPGVHVRPLQLTVCRQPTYPNLTFILL